jgi:hypothetical protein
MASKTLSIKYTADASGVLRAQASIEKSVQSLGSHITNLGKSMFRTGRVMTTSLTLPIVAGFTVAINEATQFNKVQGQTQAALKSTGGAANVTVGHIDALSTSLGHLTATDAEVVHSMENILLTFPNVRNEVGKGNAIFDKASLAVANVSARMGTDLNSAAVQVGKALGDPIRGMTALRRIGVEFSDSQVALITRLTTTGHLLGAQKVILQELNKEFGGSAQAAGAAASPLTKLNLLFREFAQQIGPMVIQIVEQVNKWLAKAISWFQKLSPGVQKAIVVALALVAALGPLILILGGIITVVGVVIELFNPWVLAIVALVAITVLLITHWQEVKSVAQTVWNAVEHVVGKAVAFLIRIFADYLSIMLSVFQAIIHGAAVAFGWIPGIGGKLKAADAAFTSFKNNMVDGLRGIADHWSTFGSQAARATAKANAEMQKLNATLIAIGQHSRIHIVIDQTGALHGGIGHRAAGGPVRAWQPYIVGERGAELFVPSMNGRIVPNGGSAGGGDTYIVNVSGVVGEPRAVAECIRQELLKVGKRNGGRTGL